MVLRNTTKYHGKTTTLYDDRIKPRLTHSHYSVKWIDTPI